MGIQTKDIVGCLKNGGIVLMPTDTVYGLLVSPNFPDSVNRLYEIKKRPFSKKLPILVSSRESFEYLNIDINDNVEKFLRSDFIPGGLTLAVGFKQGENNIFWLKDRKEVGIRIPNHSQLLEVLTLTGPLLSSSANISGTPQKNCVDEILRDFDIQPDLIVNGGIINSVSSTLVNCRKNKVMIEREGVISKEDIFKILQLE